MSSRRCVLLVVALLPLEGATFAGAVERAQDVPGMVTVYSSVDFSPRAAHALPLEAP